MLNFCMWRSMSLVSYVPMKTILCYSCLNVKQYMMKENELSGKYNKEINKKRRKQLIRMEVEKEKRHVEITWYTLRLLCPPQTLNPCKQDTFTHLWLPHFYHLTICQFASSFYFQDFMYGRQFIEIKEYVSNC